MRYAKKEIQLLRCRDLGHQWDESFPLEARRPAWGQRRVLRCDNCGSERWELVNVYGEVGSRHYKVDPLYKNVTGIKKIDARKERIKAMRASAKRRR